MCRPLTLFFHRPYTYLYPYVPYQLEPVYRFTVLICPWIHVPMFMYVSVSKVPVYMCKFLPVPMYPCIHMYLYPNVPNSIFTCTQVSLYFYIFLYPYISYQCEPVSICAASILSWTYVSLYVFVSMVHLSLNQYLHVFISPCIHMYLYQYVVCASIKLSLCPHVHVSWWPSVQMSLCHCITLCYTIKNIFFSGHDL